MDCPGSLYGRQRYGFRERYCDPRHSNSHRRRHYGDSRCTEPALRHRRARKFLALPGCRQQPKSVRSEVGSYARRHVRRLRCHLWSNAAKHRTQIRTILYSITYPSVSNYLTADSVRDRKGPVRSRTSSVCVGGVSRPRPPASLPQTAYLGPGIDACPRCARVGIQEAGIDRKNAPPQPIPLKPNCRNLGTGWRRGVNNRCITPDDHDGNNCSGECRLHEYSNRVVSLYGLERGCNVGAIPGNRCKGRRPPARWLEGIL